VRLKAILLLSAFVLFCFSSIGQKQTSHTDIRKALTDDEQKKFLSKRIEGMPGDTTFNSCSKLFHDEFNFTIHTESREISETILRPYIPDFYSPTWKEVFDVIGIQTRSSWKYDPQHDYWEFSEPAAPKPFSLTMPDGWTSKDMGLWMGYAPSNYPVGMDVYYFGSYSVDSRKPEDEANLWPKIRAFWALSISGSVNLRVTAAEMKTVSVAGVDALYFEGPAPRPGVIWRQWAFVRDGKAFVILSTLDANDTKNLSDVQSMIKSLHVN